MKVPDLLVEKLRLGELAPEEAARVRERLAAEPEGPARLEALAEDDRRTLEAHPPAIACAAIDVAARERRRASPGWLRLGVPAAFAALVALVIALQVPASKQEYVGLRAKGDGVARPRLILYMDAPSGPTVLDDGAEVHAGDTLQLAYVAAGRDYGAILSVDGRGVVTTHLAPGPLRQGGEARLGQAYVLDDAPAFERFALLTLDPTTRALEVTTVTVRK